MGSERAVTCDCVTHHAFVCLTQAVDPPHSIRVGVPVGCYGVSGDISLLSPTKAMHNCGSQVGLRPAARDDWYQPPAYYVSETMALAIPCYSYLFKSFSG